MLVLHQSRINIKARKPDELREWYRRHLGVPIEQWGGAAFSWQSPENPAGAGTTIWSVFSSDTSNFGSGPSPFMINNRVADLHALLPPTGQ